MDQPLLSTPNQPVNAHQLQGKKSVSLIMTKLAKIQHYFHICVIYCLNKTYLITNTLIPICVIFIRIMFQSFVIINVIIYKYLSIIKVPDSSTTSSLCPFQLNTWTMRLSRLDHWVPPALEIYLYRLGRINEHVPTGFVPRKDM